MTNTEALVKLGRFMITHAVNFVDDDKSNKWARVGQLLTEMGMPFAPKLTEFGSEQIATVREGAAVMSGKLEMPARMTPAAPAVPRRTRKARMTKAMTKERLPKAKAAPKARKAASKASTNKAGRPAKATSSKAAAQPVVAVGVKRGRGRPRKVAA